MNPRCPLCDHRETRLRFAKAGVPYYCCRGCRFTFARPDVNANFPAGLEQYEPAYLEYLQERPEDRRNFDDLWRWLSRARRLEETRVLDVGCGSGKLVRYLRDRSVQAYGTEPCRALYDRFLAREPSLFSDTPAGELTAVWPPSSFDLITAIDVIEHVEDPKRFLESLAHLVREGGPVCLTTPDVGSILARLSGQRWHHYNRYHLSLFSRRTLSAAAARHGLHLVRFSRRGRLVGGTYLFRYVRDFVIRGSRRAAPPAWLRRALLPVNLLDTMCLTFVKGPSAKACA
ncbi:MAG: class I SAM-dependent methyltransferase [Planctomycetota bacterium]|jgi:2-polyprenyl-3-methyl-5-hydroxy-6-metoxy-1,4-benzoquinol methylase